MKKNSGLIVLICLTELVFNNELIGAEPIPTEQEVRFLLGGIEFEGHRQLVQKGEEAFPIYEAILSNPKSTSLQIGRLFGVIRAVKTDRRRFLKHALSRLTDAHRGVRWSAVYLLEQIGTPTEASPVIALLSDEDTDIVYAAAKTLAVIGGPNEVIAMDIWLRGASHREDADLRKHVQKCRDALKKRLDNAHTKDSSK